MQTLILGVGNLLLGDEGVGVHVARALSQVKLPESVEVIDVGVAFLNVLDRIEVADRILIVDAMQAGGVPGSVYRQPFDACLHPEQLASLHGFDLSRTLYLAGNDRKPEVTVFGVEPEAIAWGMELSAIVAESLPIVLRAICKEVGAA